MENNVPTNKFTWFIANFIAFFILVFIWLSIIIFIFGEYKISFILKLTLGISLMLALLSLKIINLFDLIIRKIVKATIIGILLFWLFKQIFRDEFIHIFIALLVFFFILLGFGGKGGGSSDRGSYFDSAGCEGSCGGDGDGGGE